MTRLEVHNVPSIIMTNSRLEVIEAGGGGPAPTIAECCAMAKELLRHRRATGTVVEIIDTKELPQPGDLVMVDWEFGATKRAIYVKRTRTGTHVVRVERVDARGMPTEQFGSARTIAMSSTIKVLVPGYRKP